MACAANLQQKSSLQGITLGYGGNPYGPAGTGKTESVKALGQALARQVHHWSLVALFGYLAFACIRLINLLHYRCLSACCTGSIQHNDAAKNTD